MPFYTDFKDILRVIAQAAFLGETVEIYYPKTENNPRGWREVDPWGLFTDIPPQGEKLSYEKDRLSPGHIFNAFPCSGTKEKSGGIELRSFIVGKIKGVRRTGNKANNKTCFF